MTAYEGHQTGVNEEGVSCEGVSCEGVSVSMGCVVSSSWVRACLGFCFCFICCLCLRALVRVVLVVSPCALVFP